MHVLQVTPRYFPNIGGVEIVIQKTSETLVENGVRVTVYSVDLSHNMLKQEEINGVLVKRFTPLLDDPFYVPEPKFVATLLREKADILHVHTYVFPPFLVALFKHGKQKLLLQPHYHPFGQSPLRNSLLKLYKYALNNVVFSRADLVIANSAYEKRMLCHDFPRSRNVILIPEGIDVDEVEAVKRNPVEPKRILYVGALRRYKNVDKILKGLASLLGKGNRNFKLIIVGEGSEHQYLINLADNLGVNSFIEWKHGLSRQQLLHEFAKASVFIQLSTLESFSRSVYEALLIGVPAVVLNFGALANLVKAGLAEGVNSLNSREIAEALLKATRKTYPKISQGPNTFLNWKEYSSKIISVYHKLLERQ
jgi:glycosyltransferase involved in cell wall biosynthesis